MFVPDDGRWTPAASNSSDDENSSLEGSLTILGPTGEPSTVAAAALGEEVVTLPTSSSSSSANRFTAATFRWMVRAGGFLFGNRGAAVSAIEASLEHEPASEEVVQKVFHCPPTAHWDVQGSARRAAPGMILNIDHHDPTEEDPFGGGGGDAEDEGIEENYDVNLVVALQCYKRVPNDFYASIVTAAISQRSPQLDPIQYDELIEAGGVPFLVSLLVSSGSLQYDDPNISSTIQQYVDELIDSTLPKSIVSPADYEYLRCICQAPTTRLTRLQRDKLLRSGFEFVRLLEELPHLSWNIQDTFGDVLKQTTRRWFNFPFLVMGLALVLFELVAFVFIGIKWYWEDRNVAYYSLLVYLGGFAMDLLLTNGVGRADTSVYGEDLVTFMPSANLKIMPFLPVYHIVLFLAVVRNSFHRWRTPLDHPLEVRRYFTIDHDLYAAHVVNLVLHAMCISFPQFLLQTYFFDLSDEAYNVIFRLLAGSTGSICCFAVLLAFRQLLFFDSIDSFGFANFGTERSRLRLRHPGARLLSFVCVFLFEQNLFYFVIGIVMFDSCMSDDESIRSSAIIFLALKGSIVFCCAVLFIGVPCCPINTAYGFVVPFGIQIATTIYVWNLDKNCSSLFTSSFGFLSLGVGIGYGIIGIVTVVASIVYRCRRIGRPPSE